jgi:hypothetical protein
MIAAVLAAAAAVTLTVMRAGLASPARPTAARAPLPAASASYLGVYASGAPSGYQPVSAFGAAAGRAPNLAGYFSGWAQPFAAAFAAAARAHGAATLIQVDPTYASIAGIAAGAYDGYLRSYADSVRRFGHPVVIGFGHEMNGPWYPWGYRHVQAATFVAAWRHIVTLFRGQGADNVTWLWTVNADLSDTGPLASWWPGASYVTWVGIDGYYYRPADSFGTVFGRTIDEVRTFTAKPVLLAETAVGPRAGQRAGIDDLFAGMRTYRTLGLVWFDNAQHDGIYHQDWRIEDSAAAGRAFRLAARRELTPARQAP